MGIEYWTIAGPIDLAALRPQDLTAEILADSLAKTNRFGGRTPEPWPVTSHSVLVERLCSPDLGPWALLHDGHEALIGDITTPTVELIASVGHNRRFIEDLGVLKGRIDRSIGAAWNMIVRSMNADLRRADRVALKAESIVFLGASPEIIEPGEGEEIDRAIQILREMPVSRDWTISRDLWLDRVEHYSAHGGMTPPQS